MTSTPEAGQEPKCAVEHHEAGGLESGQLSQNQIVGLALASYIPPRMRELLSFAGYQTGTGMAYQLDMADPYVRLFGEPRPTVSSFNI